MIIEPNDYCEQDHYRAIRENNFNVSRTCEIEKNEMHHIHDTCEILFVEDGAADYFIKDKIYHVEAGDVLVIGAMEHHMRRIVALPYLRYGLTLKPAYYRTLVPEPQFWKIFTTPDIPQFVSHYKKIDRTQFEQLVAQLSLLKEEEMQKNPFALQYQRAVLTQMVICLFRIFKLEAECEPNSAVRTRIMDIKEYIDLHFKEDISLNSLSREFYLHQATVSKNFHKYCKIPLNRYINTVRICAAARMLECGDEPISVIAEACGYENINTFLRQFKTVMNITPSQYRKSLQNA